MQHNTGTADRIARVVLAIAFAVGGALAGGTLGIILFVLAGGMLGPRHAQGEEPRHRVSRRLPAR